MNIAFARLRTAALAGAFILAGTLAAQAETVFHRGNGAEPETLDPHKLTGITEANITYDLFEGLVTMDPHGQEIAGRGRELGRSATTARSTRSICARTANGRTAIR